MNPELLSINKEVWFCKDCEAKFSLRPSQCVCGGKNVVLFAITLDKVEESKTKLSECFENIVSFIGEWVDMPEDQKKLIAIWIIGTYFHKNFSTYPYLFFNAMRGSAKTRTLRIISWLQKNGNGEVLTNPSDSVMFRTAIERGLMIDEFESERSKDKQTMREYLNACYKEGGIVYRMEKQRVDNKEKQVAVGHKLFTPVAMANINGIEDVLGDRSITMVLEKSNHPALTKKIEDFGTNLKIQEIKRTLEQFSVGLCDVEYQKKCIGGWNVYINTKYTHIHTLHTIHNSTSLHEDIIMNELFRKIDDTGIFGRNLELFFPLMITARTFNEYIFHDVLKIVVGLNKIKKEDEFTESKDVSLIEFVSLADRYRFEYVFVSDLHNEFKNFIGTKGEEEDKWITSVWLGLALKRLCLIGTRKRVAKGSMILLAVDRAKEKIKMFKESSEEIKEEVKNE